jgi:outer membrane protein assembly factor BamD
MHRFPWKLAVIGLVVVSACHPEFQLKKFTTNEALYQASLRQFQRGKYDDAVAGFEKLSLELSPRDTLAARSFWYLGLSHQKQHDYQLAATAFNRIFESFPDDSLMGAALFQEGKSYQNMWTRPDRDATFGDAALATYSSLMTYRPDSPLIPDARKEIATLENWFAIKNYDVAMYYLRDKGYDQAVIYLKYVLETWPDALKAKDAGLRLVEIYRVLRYTPEAEETCSALRSRYPTDAEVKRTCRPPPVSATQPATSAPMKPPPPAGDSTAAR